MDRPDWGELPPSIKDVSESLFNAKGDLLTSSSNNTPSTLSAGSNGEFLVPNSANANGLEWVSLVTYEDEMVINDGEVVYN